MLRSIYQGILGAFGTNRRRKAQGRARGTQYPGSGSRSRRLAIESLESRTLLTVTTLTLNSISDGNFEAPALAAKAYQIAPPSSPWQFSGTAGVSSNASGFTVGNPNAPSGTQVAFLKDTGSIVQTVYLEAGVYNLSFLAAQRGNYQTQNQEIEVLIDGAEAGVVVPTSTAYSGYQTSNFTVTAGTHAVELLGLSPLTADSTAFIDEATITPVVDSIIDGGFEEPALAASTFVADPNGLAWQFSGTAGLAGNGSAFVTNSTNITQNAPAGTQVAYLQDSGSMSQTMYLDAGTYQVSFQAAQRGFDQTNYQEVEILVDGGQAGTIVPAGSTYASYQSSTFTVAAGAHTVEFLGLNSLGGDDTAFIDQVTLSAANAVSDGSFETPALDAGQYQFAPTGSAWQFSGGAGVSSNGSAFTASNPNSPDPNGTQVAIIQGNGSLSQSVDLVAGSYNLSFQAAQCATNVQSQGQQIQVLVDGAQVGLIAPVGTSYSLYETPNFTVAAGAHTIQLVGLNLQGGNNTALIDLVAIAPAQDQITDGGFETPTLAAGTYQVAPSGTPWQFSGLAGVSTNGSALTAGSANAPQGAQAGFIMNNGSMSYSVYLDTDTYSLSFLAAQRAKYQTQSQQIMVLVDGAEVAWIAPSGTTYTPYQTSNFIVAAGVHTIDFVGMSPQSADSTALIDQVAIATAENSFSDGGFETPVLTKDTYQFSPNGSAWQFSGAAGVSTNSSAFTTGSANVPDGAQVALIKNNGSMSQSVYFDGGMYSISFLAAQRALYQTQWQQIRVLVDGAQVGFITPASTSYLLYQTPNFTVAAGVHTVQFVGFAPASADSTAFLDDAAISAGGTISDGSFEQSVLAAKAYQIAPSGAAWQFSGNAGVSANNSAFTAGNPNAPDGTQVAFIKDTASMSQSVEMAAGVYNLSFMAAQRAQYQSQAQSIEVLVDGALVGTATPAGTTYGLYQTSNFTVTAGLHTVEFVGLSPPSTDSTAFIDEVQLNV